jgi:hypothetical protein
LREFVERNYGRPLVYDFAEGEFPRLLAAIRSIESQKDNRLVMVTQERLAKLRQEVRGLAPVIDRLPKAGARYLFLSSAGRLLGMVNGWMPFWIKDEAFNAGLTPNLAATQDYFLRVRTDIESA